MPVILANLAKFVAASSLVRSVATAIFAIVSVNSAIFSFWIPNCPAAAAISDSSAAVVGMLKDMFRIASSIWENSCSVAFTVFLTPAKALSNSEPTFMEAAVIPPTAAAAVADAAAMACKALVLTFCIASKPGLMAFNCFCAVFMVL